ncbi:hypothetical protein Bbelb_333180 [Branchiostoma belcheri]|nr:hypothetical protein Bbelb_333180 [Branchiostoma belcheri]
MEVRPYVEAKVAHPTIDAESSLPRGPHDEATQSAKLLLGSNASLKPGLPQVTADSEKMEEHGSEISQAIYQRAIRVPRDPKRPLVTKQITRNVKKRCDTEPGIDGLKTVAEREKYDGN